MSAVVEQIIDNTFGTSSSKALTYATTPDSNNGLIYILQGNKSAGVYTRPSGWDLVGSDYIGSSVSRTASSKKSAGTEGTVTYTHTSAETGIGALLEISGLDTTTPIDANGNDGNDSGETAVGSLLCGTIASANRDQDSQYVIGMVGLDSANWDEPVTYTNAFALLLSINGAGAGAFFLCDKEISASGDVSTTISRASTGTDQAAGMITAFNLAAAGGGGAFHSMLLTGVGA